MTDVPLNQLSFARFSEALNSVFRIQTGASTPIEVKLVGAQGGRIEEKASASGGEFESFSLIFNGPASQPIPQGTYPFEHSRIGRFDLFIVPIERNEEGFQYEAVFNRRARVA